MKKISFLLFVSISISVSAQNLEGAFNAISAQYGEINASPLDMMRERVVKIFKDGYWMAVSFGNSIHPFRGCTGGTFIVKNGKYIETVLFSSWDSTAVGKAFKFDCKVMKDDFEQKGFVNSQKYPNHLVFEEYKRINPELSLKDSSLEGVWFLQSTVWDGDDAFKAPISEMKIYAYPRFAWAQFNTETRQFVGAGGGTYQYDGSTVMEKIDYFTFDMAMGINFKVDVFMKPDGQMQQTSWGGRMVELWKRAK
jgi:hypothetical protein